MTRGATREGKMGPPKQKQRASIPSASNRTENHPNREYTSHSTKIYTTMPAPPPPPSQSRRDVGPQVQAPMQSRLATFIRGEGQQHYHQQQQHRRWSSVPAALPVAVAVLGSSNAIRANSNRSGSVLTPRSRSTRESQFPEEGRARVAAASSSLSSSSLQLPAVGAASSPRAVDSQGKIKRPPQLQYSCDALSHDVSKRPRALSRGRKQEPRSVFRRVRPRGPVAALFGLCLLGVCFLSLVSYSDWSVVTFNSATRPDNQRRPHERELAFGMGRLRGGFGAGLGRGRYYGSRGRLGGRYGRSRLQRVAGGVLTRLGGVARSVAGIPRYGGYYGGGYGGGYGGYGTGYGGMPRLGMGHSMPLYGSMGMVNGIYPNTLAGGLVNGNILGSTLPLLRRRLESNNETEAEEEELASGGSGGGSDTGDDDGRAMHPEAASQSSAQRDRHSSSSSSYATTAAPSSNSPAAAQNSEEIVEASRKAHESYRNLRAYLSRHFTLGASAVGRDEGEARERSSAGTAL